MSARLLAVAVLFVVGGVGSSARAQQPGSQSGPPPGGGDKNVGGDVMPGVKSRSNEMERVKRDAEKPEKRASAEEAFPQIKEDFERIQHVNSDVLQAAPTGEPTDYARLREGASEVKKRAARLRKNLFGAGAEGEKQPKEKDEKGAQDLKALLPALDDAINAFVHSPVFQNTGVVNPDDSAKAARDLDAVIRLSARVEREAERLSKAKGS